MIVVILLLAMPLGAAANGGSLDREDPESSTECQSFSAEVSGSWGGEFGQGAVTAFPGDDDDAGYCTLVVSAKARRLELRVLDGLADDSFDVYVKNPAGNWALVYSYADQYASETWVTHQIEGFPAGKGQGSTIEVKIVLTGPHWAHFNTFGQLAVDYIAAYEH
jgi:hypothetical protein